MAWPGWCWSNSAYPCDVSDHDSAQACVRQVQKEVGPVDVLVNNAGITRDMTFKKMDKPNWDAVMKTTAPMRLSAALTNSSEIANSGKTETTAIHFCRLVSTVVDGVEAKG